MLLRRLLMTSLLLSPLLASAHNFIDGQPVKSIFISDRGELLLDNHDAFSYRNWNTGELAGKVRIVQYIAGRKSAKKKNSMLIKAVKAANFPLDRFQPTTIVNTDDVIFGSGFFVLGKIEKNKRRYPWAQFIIDSSGLGRRTWHLNEMSSTILVLDKEGRVLWAKDGDLTPKEAHQVIAMVQKMVNE